MSGDALVSSLLRAFSSGRACRRRSSASWAARCSGSLAQVAMLALLALVLALWPVYAVGAVQSNATEAAALLEFKAALTNSKALASWDNPTDMCTNWTGLWCTLQGQVASIDVSAAVLLTDGSLVGPIDWGALAQLSAVTDINLEVNQLTGSLGAALPPALKTLFLGGNNISGTLPQDWDLPPTLKELRLGTNQLSGTLPATLRLPDRLQYLDLNNNRFSGTLSPELRFPDNLQYLDLSLNRFNGTLPSLTLPAQLELVSVGFNALTGPLPEGWVLSDGLMFLSVGSNHFSGSLPTSWQLPNTLTGLFLENNTLSGTIPAAFWASLPASLIDINLSTNRLTGTLSADWAIPRSMMTIVLTNNSLHGTLPSWPYLNATIVEVMPQVNTSFCGKIPSNPLYTQYLNPYLNQKSVDTPLSLPACLPGTDQPGPAVPGPPMGTSPAAPPPLPSTESSSSSSDVGIIIGAIAGAVAAIAAAAFGAWWWCARSRKARLVSLPGLKKAEGCSDVLYGSPLPGSSDRSCKGEIEVQQGSGSFRTSQRRLSSASPLGVLPSSSMPSTSDALNSKDSKRSWEETPEDKGAAGVPIRGSGRVHTPGLVEDENAPGTATSGPESADPANDPVLELALKAALASKATTDTTITTTTEGSSAGLFLGGSGETDRRRGSSGSLDLRMWEISYSSLKLVRQIGEGSFGRVYLGHWQQTAVAVKILLSTTVAETGDAATRHALTLSNPVLRNLQKEAALMAAMRHPNIVGFLGVVAAPPCVVTEYCARGAVSDILRVARGNPSMAEKLDWTRRIAMMLDTARGMLYLHSRSPPIIHRDLKSPNLLVDSHWRVKVSDFNLSRILEDTVALSSAHATNPRWLSPEVLAGGQAVLASDIYAFAVVMWEMLTWELPFQGENIWQLAASIAQGGRLEVPAREALPGPDTASFAGLDAYIALMQRCWAQNPDERPTFGEIADELRDILFRTRFNQPPTVAVTPVARWVAGLEEPKPPLSGPIEEPPPDYPSPSLLPSPFAA